MEAIKITVLPNVKRSESAGIHIGIRTNERLLDLADRMDISVSRIADYLLNVAMDNVEITVMGGDDG